MRKKTLLLFLLAASVMMTGGCRKKSQEKMDLTSTHTTAAETMDPETTAAETKSSKKPEETTKAADVSASVSGSTKIETYHPKDFPAGSIAYPVVAHMKDETKQSQVNDLLYQNAISICDALDLKNMDYLTIDCKVVSLDTSRITVVYQGEYYVKQGAYPVQTFYTNTVDLNQVKSLGINDYSDAYTMAGYLMSDDARFVSAEPESTSSLWDIHFVAAEPKLTSALWDYRSSQSIDYFTDLLNKADFPSKNEDTSIFPESFSYLSNSTLYFSIPVPHALGDYAIVAYPMDGK